jgi:Methyltransferase domain
MRASITPGRLLYVDGVHTEEMVAFDTEAWVPALAPGALVVFDGYENSGCPGVRGAVEVADEAGTITFLQSLGGFAVARTARLHANPAATSS